VKYADLVGGPVGFCDVDLDPIHIPGQMDTHYQLVPLPGQPMITLTLDNALPPDMTWKLLIHMDGFETSDLVFWDYSEP
jgi:hypothetical protein